MESGNGVVEAFQASGKQMRDDTGIWGDFSLDDKVTAEDLFGQEDGEGDGEEDDEDGEDGEKKCTMEELQGLFTTLNKDFRAYFAAVRKNECVMAKKLLGHAADYPTYEIRQEIKKALKNDSKAKLSTFGYRRAGPHKMKYWLEEESNVPDLSVKDGCIDMDKLPKELLYHV